jgi:hypothetical protein
MNKERTTILYLVAVGRITPRDAERLLALWSGEDEFILRMAVCCAAFWAFCPHFRLSLDGYAALFPAVVFTLRHSLACLGAWFGGMI